MYLFYILLFCIFITFCVRTVFHFDLCTMIRIFINRCMSLSIQYSILSFLWLFLCLLRCVLYGIVLRPTVYLVLFYCVALCCALGILKKIAFEWTISVLFFSFFNCTVSLSSNNRQKHWIELDRTITSDRFPFKIIA